MAGEAMAAGQASALGLAQLLAARLCHDLNGPLSGLSAALGEMPDDPAATSLAIEAAQVLRDRIALFGAAWGKEAPALTADGLRAFARGLPNAARLDLRLDGLARNTAFPPAVARVVLNVLLLAAESVQGTGTVVLSGGPARQVVAAIGGRRAAWPAGLGAMLASADAAWHAADALCGAGGLRGLQAPLTALLAHQAGVPASLLMARAAEQAPPLLLDLSAAPVA